MNFELRFPVLLGGLGLLGVVATICAADAPPQSAPSANIDFAGFVKLTAEVEAFRESRRVSLDQFLELAAEEGVVVLDARSKEAFDRKHLRGATHLSFSDFTTEKLETVIPRHSTRVLIYCNNNFQRDPANFATKKLELALNIPTFINLYGYGYRDLYELGELISVDDPRLHFEGTAVESSADADGEASTEE